jgi:hypothetical protein
MACFKFKSVILATLGAALFSMAAGAAGVTGAPSLNDLVYGNPDASVPAGANISRTMMGQMRSLFDRIKGSPDFTQVKMDLGDGDPVYVLNTKTGDKFLPGKLALGLSYVLIDMKQKKDPAYPEYLATYTKVTEAMMLPMDPAKPTNYLYVNNSWGEYYYLLALNNLRAQGMLEEAFGSEMLAALEKRLTLCDMYGADGSGVTDVCPKDGSPIDVATLNLPTNYYAVSYGIAGLRQKLGWGNPAFTAADDPALAQMDGRDALLETTLKHYRKDSSGGFSDEANNRSKTFYDEARYDRYSALLIGEIVQRSFEMGNAANISDEMKGYLRKSVDLVLPQLNVDGKGFNYGRSIGPYGDTAFMELLTAAAYASVLTPDEKKVAYAFVTKAAQRFHHYWYDATLPTPSVNMWVKGRGTDTYRNRARVMGENFSLLHQYMYVSGRWNEMGFRSVAPMSDKQFQAWLDKTLPRYRLTWYNQPNDAAHPYSAALVTVRDGRRVINLNLSQAPEYSHLTPYFPTPISDRLVYGTTDQSYPLLVPQINYEGKNYLPVTYYKNLAVQEKKGVVTVSFETQKFRLAEKNPKYETDLDLQVKTEIIFGKGSISRTDTLASKTLAGNATVRTDYTSFAPTTKLVVEHDGLSVKISDDVATAFATQGFDKCELTGFATKADGKPNLLSTTPIGQLQSAFSCTSASFVPNAEGRRSFGWTLKYADRD